MSTILVIEDEPDQSKLIRLRLEARGYRVISVGKAREGIELARKEKPALILMDMILPDMHGLDAAIKLKQDPETRATPVIGISAVGSPDFIKTCLQEGISAYVRKPYDPRELFRTIEKFAKPGEPIRRAAGPAAPAAPGATRREPAPASPLRSPAPLPRQAARRQLSGELDEILSKLKKNGAAAGPEKPPVGGHGRLGKKEIDELIQGALGDLTGSKKPPAAPGPRPEAAARPASPPSRILIVDDDSVFVKAVSGHLSERGYEICLAADGVRALREAFLKRPDLILLSLVLPAGGGEQVLTNLRKSPETRGIPVFIMSGILSAKMLEEKAGQLGARGFISKPIEPEDLLYIIESVAGG